MRVHAEQVCPEFCMQLFTPAGIALSNGASSSTTNADLPPSSRHTFLMPSPATDAMRRPACERAGEAHHVDVGMRDDGFADDAARARDDVEHAGRQADLVRGFGEHERAERRHLRRLQHDRAAGGERRRDLADHLVQRVVPRRDAADDADRLLDDERVAELFFELRLADELRVHPDHHDRELGLHLGGEPERGADFVRDRLGDLRHARLHRGRRASRATARAPRRGAGSTIRSRAAPP